MKRTEALRADTPHPGKLEIRIGFSSIPPLRDTEKKSIEAKENSQQIRTSTDELSALSDKRTQLASKFKI